MLSIAVILLIVAAILWAAGAILHVPALLVGAKAAGAIGVILLLVWLILLLVNGGFDLATTR